MAISDAGTVAADMPDQAFQSPFDESDHCLARQWRPRLYCQIEQDRVSFDHIAQALWIGNNPDRPVEKEEQRVSQFRCGRQRHPAHGIEHHHEA